MLDRYKNFTLFLEIGHNVTLPEKCMNLTCRQVWLINQKESTDVHKRKDFYQVTFTSVYCTKCFMSKMTILSNYTKVEEQAITNRTYK